MRRYSLGIGRPDSLPNDFSPGRRRRSGGRPNDATRTPAGRCEGREQFGPLADGRIHQRQCTRHAQVVEIITLDNRAYQKAIAGFREAEYLAK